MKIAVMDIGGSFIKYALMNETLVLSHQDKVATPLSSMDDLWQTLDGIWSKIGAQAQGLAISMPGVIDSENGVAHTGGALQYIKDYEFEKELTKRYHVPAWIGNDAKCAAIAEIGYGALSDVEDAIVIILGTAIGGCLIKDKKVHNGKHFAAGEVSNLYIDYKNPHNPDTSWYKVSGKEGLLKIVQKHLNTTQVYSGEEIFDLASQNNASVLAAIDEYACTIATQLFNMQVIFDAEKIAVGGGISAQSLLIEKIREQFAAFFNDPYCCIQQVPIVACQFRNDANLIGAYYQLQLKINH